jgi:hypothetical protein
MLTMLASCGAASVLVASCDADRATRPPRAPTSIAVPAPTTGPTLATTSTIAATIGPDTTVDMPNAFTLNASFADATGTAGPWSYTISWGDQTSSAGTATDATVGIIATHSYGREGTDTVVFTVTNPSGSSASDNAVITVVDHVLKITVTPSRADVDVGTTTQFSAKTYGTTGNLLIGRTVTWKSSSTAIATVSIDGLMTAVSAGPVRITAMSELETKSVTVNVYGLAFGPFHLPDSLFAKPYTGLLRASTPANLLATLKAARKKHLRVVLKLANDSKDYSNPDSSFSLDLWKQVIDGYRGIDFRSYITDGTIIGHFLIDEPRDASNWGGIEVPYADIEAAAAYSKSIWPTMPTGAGSPADDMEAGAPYVSLDFAFSQYRDKKGDLATWLAGQTASARRSGLGLLLSINVLDGNIDNSSYSAAQLSAVGSTLAAEPYACGLTMWKYDSTYFADAAVKLAMADIAKVANARPRHRCGPD